MKRLAFIIALTAIFVGCGTIKTVPVTEVRTEYRNIIDYVHDTTIVKDSVWIKEHGDTIFIDRWHTRDRVVLTTKVDSFVRVDTIPIVTEVEIPVHYRSGYDRFCSWFMWIVIAVLLSAVGWRMFKRYYLHIG